MKLSRHCNVTWLVVDEVSVYLVLIEVIKMFVLMGGGELIIGLFDYPLSFTRLFTDRTILTRFSSDASRILYQCTFQ
uniref:Ovule protein n=1 Tax=Strongyloides venezuelensis TaxID=75913 RepID=A0A0K0FWT9_STRVS